MQQIRPKGKPWFCSKSKEPGGCKQNINKTGNVKSSNKPGKMKYLFYSELGCGLLLQMSILQLSPL